MSETLVMALKSKLPRRVASAWSIDGGEREGSDGFFTLIAARSREVALKRCWYICLTAVAEVVSRLCQGSPCEII